MQLRILLHTIESMGKTKDIRSIIIKNSDILFIYRIIIYTTMAVSPRKEKRKKKPRTGRIIQEINRRNRSRGRLGGRWQIAAAASRRPDPLLRRHGHRQEHGGEVSRDGDARPRRRRRRKSRPRLPLHRRHPRHRRLARRRRARRGRPEPAVLRRGRRRLLPILRHRHRRRLRRVLRCCGRLRRRRGRSGRGGITGRRGVRQRRRFDRRQRRQVLVGERGHCCRPNRR